MFKYLNIIKRLPKINYAHNITGINFAIKNFSMDKPLYAKDFRSKKSGRYNYKY